MGVRKRGTNERMDGWMRGRINEWRADVKKPREAMLEEQERRREKWIEESRGAGTE